MIGGAVVAMVAGLPAVAQAQPKGATAGGDELVSASVARERAAEMRLEASQEPSPHVRANPIEALEGASGRTGQVALRGMSDPNVGVRTVAAMVVGRAQLRDAAPAARALLTDSSAYVRAAAIYALRRCGHDENPTPLATMVSSHPDAPVLAHAAFILGALRDRSAIAMSPPAAISPAVCSTPRAAPLP